MIARTRACVCVCALQNGLSHAGVYPIPDMQQIASQASPSAISTESSALSTGDIALSIIAEVASLYPNRDSPKALIAAWAANHANYTLNEASLLTEDSMRPLLSTGDPSGSRPDQSGTRDPDFSRRPRRDGGNVGGGAEGQGLATPCMCDRSGVWMVFGSSGFGMVEE